MLLSAKVLKNRFCVYLEVSLWKHYNMKSGLSVAWALIPLECGIKLAVPSMGIEYLEFSEIPIQTYFYFLESYEYFR